MEASAPAPQERLNSEANDNLGDGSAGARTAAVEVSPNQSLNTRLPTPSTILSPTGDALPPHKAADIWPLTAARNKDISLGRFIGDLSPEGILMAAASPEATTSSSAGDNIGIWITDSQTGGATRLNPTPLLRPPRSNAFYFSDPVIQKLLLPHLEDQCLACLPNDYDYKSLSTLYFAKVHPLFPIIDEKALDVSASDSSVVILRQAICLAASMHDEASDHLKFSSDSSALAQADFALKLTTAIRTTIDLVLITDKTVLIQIFALLSLFTPSTDGGDLASQFLSRAVCHVHSMGLHVAGHARIEDSIYSERLYACVWALDRINAALHGRPVLMHERDTTRKLDSLIDKQEPCFQLLLRILVLFEDVIEIYRPANNMTLSSYDREFPDFEQLVVRSGASRINMAQLATLETFYHAIAMLSHRMQAAEETSRSSAPFVRQSLSAARVTAIVGEEFVEQLSLLPVVPYAVSLSLGVAYRELRYSKIPMYQARARTQLQANSKILRQLGQVFPSASAMAIMAEHLLGEMDRVATASTGRFGAASRKKVATTPAPRSERRRSNRIIHTQTAEMPLSTQLPSVGDTLAATAPSIEQEFSSFDANPLDGMLGMDLFSQFSPGFDLAAIDSAFCGTLDLSFPSAFDVP